MSSIWGTISITRFNTPASSDRSRTTLKCKIFVKKKGRIICLFCCETKRCAATWRRCREVLYSCGISSFAETMTSLVISRSDTFFSLLLPPSRSLLKCYFYLKSFKCQCCLLRRKAKRHCARSHTHIGMCFIIDTGLFFFAFFVLLCKEVENVGQ